MATRRLLLALAGAAAISAPMIEGCAAQFDPPSKINGLRVLSVVASEPYVTLLQDKETKEYLPKTVKFEMTYHDGYVDPETGEQTAGRQVQIVWLGPCVDPPGDQYYACYEQFAQPLAELQEQLGNGGGGGGGGQGGGGAIDPSICTDGMVVGGIKIKASCFGPATSFDVDIPADIVTRRPPPTSPPHYGVAYVFFLVCAGEIRFVTDSSDGRAGSFPVGCFDPITGARLGADSFVPGYTQIYSFADERVNCHPPLDDLTLDGAPITAATRVKPCPVSEEDRRTLGCGSEDPFTACDPVEMKVTFAPTKDCPIADVDPGSKSPDGTTLTEAVWVDYFATGGDFDASVKLVSDPEKGFNSDLGSEWIAPSKNSVVTFYAVVHDARGGQAVISRELTVTDEAAPPPGGSGGAAAGGAGAGAPAAGGGP